MTDLRLALRILALILGASALATAQGTPFAFVKDQIPAEAGPVLGLADFDQDGDLDLLTNGTGIYLNDGHGNFTPHPVLSAVIAGAGGWVTGFGDPVAIGDLNGDGYPDVVSYDGTGQTYPALRKWINQGNGVLVGSALIAAGAPSLGFSINYPIRSIAAGDVDGDGDLDLAFSFIPPPICGTGGSFLPPLSLWLNNGAGVFTDTPAQFPAQPTMPSQIALADIDNDGDLDLVCGGESLGLTAFLAAQIFTNTGGGLFSQTPLSLGAPTTHDAFAIGDLDGDGLKDLVLTASPRSSCTGPLPPAVFHNAGGGAFTLLTSTAAGAARCISLLIDVDGNGADEVLILAYHASTIHSVAGGVLGLPIATLPATVSSWSPTGYAGNVTRVAAGDLDGDGDRDLVLCTAQGNRAFFNDSIGHLVAATPALEAPGVAWPMPNPADLDGDGNVDLVLSPLPTCGAAPGPALLPVAFNDGSGSLTPGAPIPCSGISSSVLIGSRAIFDVDGDGDLDLYLTGSPTAIPPANTVHHVLKKNGGTFSLWQTLTYPGTVTATVLKAGDLDGDGDLDLVVAGNPSFVLLNNGSGTFQTGATLAAGTTPFDAALVDVDGDLDLDVVLPVPGLNMLFLNDGSAGFVQSPALPAFNAYSVSVAAADFDGDGDQDLLLNNLRFVNNGTGGFTAATPLQPPSIGNYQGVFTAFDVDLDNFPDVVNSYGLLYRNLGGAFAAPVSLPASLTCVHADFDRDGDEDLVAFGPSILMNTTRQLSRGKPPRPGRPASLELAGPPAAPWLLFASYGTGNLPVPGLGTVFLDLATAQFAYGGAFSPTGSATVSGTVPAGPMWVGTSVYWQAIVYQPQGARLTGLEVMTIANY